MKRLIKFRGKRTDTGEWIFGYLLMWENRDCEIITQKSSIDCDKITVDPDTVGQFTGLLDKNGKEIYEGDILLDRFEDKEEETGYCEVYNEVAFRNGCFGQIGENTGELLPFEKEKESWEIAGNVFDNPELLKGGKE